MQTSKLVGDAAADLEQRPSIAVLPFRMNLASPDQSYFVDGIVDDIIRGLAGLKELFIVSRGSTLGYGGRNIDVREIGRQLGVRYVLYGSVRRTTTILRIGTELSDAASGEVIRSDQYEGNPGDVFALQDRIAISVVKTIAPQVRDRELMRALRKHPQNLTAYDLVLQASELLYRGDYDSFSKTRGLLEQAISYDPNYALAYSFVALWYVRRIHEFGSSDPDADAIAAAKYAAEAVERGGEEAFALAVYGHMQSFLYRDFHKAKLILQRATAAGPSSAFAWTMASVTSGYLGDGPAAVHEGEQGVRLSPLDTRSFWHEGLLGQAHYVNGDYEQALEWVQSALNRRNGVIGFTQRLLIVTLAALGQRTEAEQAARRFLLVQPNFRISSYAKRCPFQGTALEAWLGHLRSAGLPD